MCGRRRFGGFPCGGGGELDDDDDGIAKDGRTHGSKAALLSMRWIGDALVTGPPSGFHRTRARTKDEGPGSATRSERDNRSPRRKDMR
jgi:hypothetical protein